MIKKVTMNKFKIEHHVKHLQDLHNKLAKKIVEEETHYGNCTTIAILKKKKLKLKDEIESFKSQTQ
jgi:hypothetical protein